MGMKYFQEAGAGSVYNLHSLTEKLNSEWRKSENYSPAYHHSWNWSWKVILYFILCILIFIYGISLCYRKSETRKLAILLMSLPAIFAFSILACTVFIKMEDRVIAPIGIILFTGVFLILLTSREISVSKWKMRILIVILLCISLFRIPGYFEIAEENEKSRFNSAALVEWANSQFTGEIILVDYYSRFLFHGNALQNFTLGNENTFLTSWGQRASFEFSKYTQFLNSMCPVGMIDEFYECAAQNELIFFIPDFNALMLQSYLDILYGKKIWFRKIAHSGPEKEIRHSFLWFPVRYSWFMLDSVAPEKEFAPHP